LKEDLADNGILIAPTPFRADSAHNGTLEEFGQEIHVSHSVLEEWT
jgi:hypothetical protein